MESTLTRYADTPDDILDAVSPMVRRVLSALQEDLLEPLVAPSGSKAISVGLHDFSYPLRGMRVEDLLNSRGGIGTLGAWGLRNTSRRRLHRDSKMLVHWPTLLANAYDIFRHAPSMAFYILSFREVLERKSPILYTTLHRKYCQDLLDHAKERENPITLTPTRSTQSPMPTGMAEGMRAYLQEVAKDETFVYALQVASRTSYLGKSLQSEVQSLHSARGALDPKIVAQSSLICPAVIPKEVKRPVSLPDDFWRDDRFKNKGYYPAQLNSFLLELGMAVDMSRKRPSMSKQVYENYTVGLLGLAHLSGITFINWNLWYPHRYYVHQHEPYRVLVQKHLRGQRRKLKMYPRDVIPHIDTALDVSYRRVRAPVSGCEGADIMKRFWLRDLADGHVSAINVERFNAEITKLFKRGLTLDERKATYKKERPPLVAIFKVFDVEKGDRSTYRFEAMHFGRTIRFRPPWDMSTVTIYHPRRRHRGGYTDGKYLKGVYEHPGVPGLWYTAEFLSKTCPSGDPTAAQQTSLPASEVYAELRRIARLRRSDFAGKVHKRRAVTPQERLVIKLKYRPNMTDAQWEELNELCGHRSRATISTIATSICRELVAKGVYNIDDLPHGQYNANLGRMIAEAKAKEAKEKQNG